MLLAVPVVLASPLAAQPRSQEGLPPERAVVAAGRRRFRPILLTSLTTFAGLIPMIFETSTQALFLVPMAIALGFGTFLSAPVVLLLPACMRSLKVPGTETTPATYPPPPLGEKSRSV